MKEYFSGQLHALATLPPGKEPLVPTGEEAGWAPITQIGTLFNKLNDTYWKIYS
jgi:hypothetical protein